MTVRKIFKRIVLAAVALAAGLYILLVAGVWAFQDQLMFGRRTHDLRENPSERGWTFEDVWRDVDGYKTHGWWMPLDNARGTVLFSHGSGHNISHYLADVAIFRDLGMSVLIYDYGGYGQSTGAPSEARCYADAHAMWDWLTKEKAIPPENIALSGASMGGGVTCGLASDVTPGAIVLECTFTSVPDVLGETYPFIPAHLISHIQFKNIAKVGMFKCPVLVIHSEDDTVVPFAEGKRLYAAVTAPKTFVAIHGSHGGGKFSSGETYTTALKTFFQECFLKKRSG